MKATARRPFRLQVPAFFLSAMLPAIFLVLAVAQTLAQNSTGMGADNPLTLIRAGQDQKKAVRISDSIFQAIGFGNTFLVVTPAGNVIIDTSLPFNAARHRQLLRADDGGMRLAPRVAQ
ncbi:MAG: hypothetical protein EBU88_03070 [Acidobacteria bacterium]|nr:hypothetical protein [Acidobacteriota bacterium]